MLTIPDEVVTGAPVNAIAVVGRQISKAVAGSHTAGDPTAARWFETFRMIRTLLDQPELFPTSRDRLAGILRNDMAESVLQELLAARLTDAPETGASWARDDVHVTMTDAGSDATRFAEALADYYDSQICALIARVKVQESPLLARARSEDLPVHMITFLGAIEQYATALATEDRWLDAWHAIELLEAGT